MKNYYFKEIYILNLEVILNSLFYNLTIFKIFDFLKILNFLKILTFFIFFNFWKILKILQNE